MKPINPNTLLDLAVDDELMEIGRRAVEDELVEWRDSTMSCLRRNGLAIANKDGTPSSIIRFGFEHGMQIALKAVVKHLENQQ